MVAFSILQGTTLFGVTQAEARTAGETGFAAAPAYAPTPSRVRCPRRRAATSPPFPCGRAAAVNGLPHRAERKKHEAGGPCLSFGDAIMESKLSAVHVTRIGRAGSRAFFPPGDGMRSHLCRESVLEGGGW